MKLIIPRITICCLMMAISQNANATTQIRDRLHDGWWTHDIIGTEIPSDMLYGTNGMSFESCSACWRGYVAKWTLRNKQLYLVSATKFDGGPIQPITATLAKDGPALASWFTGDLYSPKVRVLVLPSNLTGGIYLGYLKFTFAKGLLLSHTFTFEPIGAGILVVELAGLWWIGRWFLRKRNKTAQPTDAASPPLGREKVDGRGGEAEPL